MPRSDDETPERSKLLCLSHLRWQSVFQRPHHLMTRAARLGRVFFWEEPCYGRSQPELEVFSPLPRLQVAVPHLPHGMDPVQATALQTALLDEWLEAEAVHEPVLWYYTPMALGFSHHLHAAAVVYDCMDELSAFAGAPPSLQQQERALLKRADVVLTGGQSLYEAKAPLHRNVHAFPSSVDVGHFNAARGLTAEPTDQAAIARPRLGYIGVIDERMDLPLLRGVAEARPQWQLILVGPVAKIDPATLPRAANIHYLGPKPYAELPAYLSGWDVALLPFARNASTRFISPTKTPEYLAAGRPVVSTSIRDVVRPYGERQLVRIADRVPEFVTAIEAALQDDRLEWLRRVDELLRQMSWDTTWSRMLEQVGHAIAARKRVDAMAGRAAGVGGPAEYRLTAPGAPPGAEPQA